MSSLPNAQAIASPGRHRFAREVVLLACLALLVVFFAYTAFITRMYHKKIHVLADEWFAKGEASFQSGDIAAAQRSPAVTRRFCR